VRLFWRIWNGLGKRRGCCASQHTEEGYPSKPSHWLVRMVVLSIAANGRSNCSNDDGRPHQGAECDIWRMMQCSGGLISQGIGDDQAEGISQDGLVMLPMHQVMGPILSHFDLALPCSFLL